MKSIAVALCMTLSIAMSPLAFAEGAAPAPIQKIALPGVSGGLDHLAIDSKTDRLFVAAKDNNTLEVIDLKEGKPAKSVPGFNKPHAVVVIPDLNKIYVSNGGTGEVFALDAASLAIGAKVKFAANADFMTYSAEDKKLYVGYDAGIGVIDVTKDAIVGDIKLESAPKSFQIGRGGATIYANLSNGGEIAVIDRAASTVATKWKLSGASGNSPMALNPQAGYVMVGCRTPGKFVVLDMANGDELASADADGGADDLFLDLQKDKGYMSCGDGFVDVFVRDGDGCKKALAIATRKGAKTSLFVRETGKYYIALPKNDAEGAEIWVFDFSK